VAEGPSGIAVPPGDAAALAEALQRLAADPGMRVRMGEAARRQAVAQWDQRLLAARFCEVAELAAAAPARRFPLPAGGHGARAR
jgi:glycosyltransferase involved in cell wall biosynthesis